MRLTKRLCACGRWITADPRDPMAAMVAHVRSEPHFSWSNRTSLLPREAPTDSTAEPATPVDVSGRREVRPVGQRFPMAGRKIA